MVHWNSREKKTHPHPACCTLLSFLTGSPSTFARAHFQLLHSHSPGTGQSLGPLSLWTWQYIQSQGIYVEEAGEPHLRIKDVICRGIKGVSRVVLLEVMLCFLQSPQSAQQHTSLHHGAGIGLGSHVRQVILHRQSDRKSRWTCTPCYIQL